MNRDDIIRLAREAGLDGYGTPLPAIERFAALVAAAKREEFANYLDDCGEHEHANYIRSRGEVKP